MCQESCYFSKITNQGIECQHPKAYVGAAIPAPAEKEKEPVVNIHYINLEPTILCRLAFLARIQEKSISQAQSGCPAYEDPALHEYSPVL